MSAETLFFCTFFFQNALILRQNKILTSNQLQMATNFLNFCNRKGDFKYLQPLWSFSNSNTGLICSKNFDDVREILVQFNNAVYGLVQWFLGKRPQLCRSLLISWTTPWVSFERKENCTATTLPCWVSWGPILIHPELYGAMIPSALKKRFHTTIVVSQGPNPSVNNLII